MPRVKCSILDRNKEKAFSRIATRGVVKFFNVCNQEQKEIECKLEKEAGAFERKRDKILSSIDKGSFLDRLRESNPLDEDESNTTQIQADEPTWSVLRDNFILGSTKVKDWNKQGEENEQNESNHEDNDDDDEDDVEVNTKKRNNLTKIKIIKKQSKKKNSKRIKRNN